MPRPPTCSLCLRLWASHRCRTFLNPPFWLKQPRHVWPPTRRNAPPSQSILLASGRRSRNPQAFHLTDLQFLTSLPVNSNQLLAEALIPGPLCSCGECILPCTSSWFFASSNAALHASSIQAPTSPYPNSRNAQRKRPSLPLVLSLYHHGSEPGPPPPMPVCERELQETESLRDIPWIRRSREYLIPN